MVKKLFTFCRPMFFLGLFCLFGNFSLSAEAGSIQINGPEEFVVHIDDLSIPERDLIVRSISNEPGMSVQFMCVPAGILVISCENAVGNDLTEKIRTSLNDGNVERIELVQGKERSYAEQACANARADH